MSSRCENLPLASFLLSLIFLLFLYRPLLLPLLDNRLEFAYGDFFSTIGVNSGANRCQMTYFTFSPRYGALTLHINRAFLLQSMSVLAYLIRITDGQIQSVIILVSIILGCYGIYKLVALFEKNKKHQAILIPTLTLFYYLNLWSTERIGHIWIWDAYAIFPPYLYFGLVYMLDKKSKYLIAYSLLFAFYGIIPPNFIYMLIIHMFLAISSIFLADGSVKRAKNLLLFIGGPIVIYSLMNMPSLLLLLIAEGLEYPIPMSLDQLVILSRNGNLLNIFTFSNNWWPQVPTTLLENLLFRVTSLLLFTFALSAVSFAKGVERGRKTLILFSSAFVIGLIFFIQGTNNLLLLNLINLLGRLGYIDVFAPFREWGRLSIVIPIFLIIMLTISLASLRGKRGHIVTLFLLALVALNIATSPSLIYINEVYSPVNIPLEYYSLSEEIPIDHKVLWVYPSSAESILGSWRYVWNKQKAISKNLEESIGATHNEDFEYVKMLSQKEAPQQLLNALNIKYVIKRTDILAASNFKVEYSYLNCKKLNYLTVCENPCNLTLFYVSAFMILSDLDGESFYAISFPSFPSYVVAITKPRSDITKVAQVALPDFESVWLYEEAKEKGIILSPFKFTYFVNPGKLWSRASTADPLHADWHPYLEKFGIENWQSDYGEGLAFTWAIYRLKENPTPSDNDLIKQWVFNSINDFNEWKNHTCENQFGSLYTLTLDNNTLKAELWNSTWGWKTINSPIIPAEYGDWYRWHFQIKTENAYEVHVKIIEYNQDKQILNVKYIEYIGSGTLNWQTIIIDYAPENPETKYIQLQIWHGHETTQPLPNRIWIDNVRIYDMKRFIKPVALEIPFNIKENGEYIFLVRLFQNRRGGRIQIQLDNKSYTVNTKDQLNKFVWKGIDIIRLEKGGHKITLTNLKGFNAINLFALIPKQEYQKAQKQIEEILQDKRIIYILEAETDLYYQNVTVSNKYGGNASNGQVLQLNQESKAYSEIEIVKPGNYTLAIRAKGNLAIKIDEKEYKISSPQLNWTYIRPIHLEKGKYKIEITNLKDQPSDLDVVWLYSIQNENETLEDIFTAKEIPAEVISCRKIDPTKYVVKVNATKPFMLSFAESYDPLWVAYVNGGKIQSTPLYGVINGFWINQTGLLEITIEYEPQKWFYYGSAVSLPTFTGCILYLAKRPLCRLLSKFHKLKPVSTKYQGKSAG